MRKHLGGCRRDPQLLFVIGLGIMTMSKPVVIVAVMALRSHAFVLSAVLGLGLVRPWLFRALGSCVPNHRAESSDFVVGVDTTEVIQSFVVSKHIL